AEFRTILNDEELARAGRLVRPTDSARFIVARAGLRRVLGAYSGGRAEDIRFALSPSGKPRLGGTTSLHFNISHSGDLAAYALARVEVGVDIEQLRQIDRPLELAARFFAGSEHSALAALAPNDVSTAFLRCWTRKEAYVKALGVGILTE